MTNTILVLNGPNLNLLGTREPDIYGRLTLADIKTRLQARAAAAGYQIRFEQSNHEGVLVDHIHKAATDGITGLVFNAGAFTHTSIALRDAILATGMICVEVHLSNIFKREPFRHHSYLSDISLGIISGFSAASYDLGLEALIQYLNQHLATSE